MPSFYPQASTNNQGNPLQATTRHSQWICIFILKTRTRGTTKGKEGMAQVAPPVDIESLTNTLGTAVLNADDGSVVKASGELESDLETTKALYQMLLDTGAILGDEPLRRITG